MMTLKITVSESDVRRFRATPGNPHLIIAAGRVWVVDEDYYAECLPGAPVIMTRADLDAIDPDADDNADHTLAALFTYQYEEFGEPEPHRDQPLRYRCPQCWEPARAAYRTHLTSGEAQLVWAHHDAGPLCPVIGANGYQPAAPVPAYR